MASPIAGNTSGHLTTKPFSVHHASQLHHKCLENATFDLLCHACYMKLSVQVFSPS